MAMRVLVLLWVHMDGGVSSELPASFTSALAVLVCRGNYSGAV